jgi:hypothetical protein
MNAILKAIASKRNPPPVRDPGKAMEKDTFIKRTRETVQYIETGSTHLDSREREVIRIRFHNYLANLETGGEFNEAVPRTNSIEELTTRISDIIRANFPLL